MKIEKIEHDLAGIVQEIEDCTQEINFLKAKQEKLLVKEKDLSEKTTAFSHKLQEHEKEMLDSLQTVILMKPEEKISLLQASKQSAPMPDVKPSTAIQQVQNSSPEPSSKIQPEKEEVLAEQKSLNPSSDSIYKVYKQAEHSRFPKSIVKTDKGRILGEYYYDPKVYKNSRSYIFNGKYFIDQLRKGVELFRIDETNATILNDFVLMASDILNRIQTRNNIHFEVSTNEILNSGSLTELMENIKTRELNKIDGFCSRYAKKIEMLGQNHEMILAEQLANLSNVNSNAS